MTWDENDRPAIEVSSPLSSILHFFIKSCIILLQKKTVRFWHKACLKMSFKFMSTYKKTFFKYFVLFLFCCNIFLSNLPKQIDFLNLICRHTKLCQLLCQFYLQTLHKHLTCVNLHLKLIRLRNFCKLEGFRKVINCIYKIRCWLNPKLFFS